MSTTIESISRYIEQNNINFIMSDIFDTILCRSIHPEHVKRLTAARISDIFPPISATNLYDLRHETECFLYNETDKAVGNKEFTYEKFLALYYENLKSKYNEIIYLDKAEFCQKHLAIELAIELRVQIPDKVIINFLRMQKNNGTKIVLLSDFYMNSNLIKKMLKYHQLQDISEHLIVSSDHMKTKREGDLYQFIIDNNIISMPKRTLMIGDNIYSDIEMANKYGFHTHYINRAPLRKKYELQEKKSSQKKDFLKNMDEIFKKDAIPFEHMPLIILNFTRKLYKECIKHGIKNLYFMSREGRVVKDVFDKFQTYMTGEISPREKISTYYLLVSRKSTAGATLRHLEKENFETLFRQYIKLSLSQFCLSYGFSEEKVSEICDTLGIDFKEIHQDLPSSKSFSLLLQNKAFCEYYENFRRTAKQNFISYLHSLNFNPQKNDSAFIDVGWKGTIQDHIYKCFDGLQKIRGFYLGLIASGISNENNIKHGLLFDFRQKSSTYYYYIQNISLFELVLTAPHGSVLGYSNDGHNIYPVLDKNQAEETLYKEKISPIQENINKKVMPILSLLDNYTLSFDSFETYINKRHKQKMFKPAKYEIEWFNNCYHFENFGIFDYSFFQKGENSKTLIASAKAIKNLAFNRMNYFNGYSFWPVAKLKNDGLSFLVFPYLIYLTYLKKRA